MIPNDIFEDLLPQENVLLDGTGYSYDSKDAAHNVWYLRFNGKLTGIIALVRPGAESVRFWSPAEFLALVTPVAESVRFWSTDGIDYSEDGPVNPGFTLRFIDFLTRLGEDK